MNSVKKTNNDLDLLKKHLEERKPFKIYFDDDDMDLDYWKYDEKENCYHGILDGDIEVLRLDIENMLRAIVDDNYFIKLEII